MSIIQGTKVIASRATNGFSLFDYKHADHLLNNVSWLRADTFSWQSGNVYKYAYQHLLDEANKTAYYIPSITEEDTGTVYYTWKASNGKYYATLKETPVSGDAIYGYDKVGNVTMSVSETLSSISSEKLTLSNGAVLYRARDALQIDVIDNIEIPCFIAEDKHKICLPDQENNIIKLFNATGAADYYIVDKTNSQFKLPRKYKRKLVRSLKDAGGTWYRLYSDGWVEQGGIIPTGISSVTFPIQMLNIDYYYAYSYLSQDNANNMVWLQAGAQTISPTSMTFSNFSTVIRRWEVKGYAHDSEYLDVGMDFEYYYVGNFETTSLEQTAGLNAELLSGKLDADLANEMLNKKINIDLTNIPFGYDIVIEYQTPTSTNNYTWYRKYKSGWVEQGCCLAQNVSSSGNTFTLPVPMANSYYSATITPVSAGGDGIGMSIVSRTQTTITFKNKNYGSSNTYPAIWQVSGMAA